MVVEADDLLLAWPQTYMNRSGYAARCLAERHDLEAQDLLVVYDAVALPLGRLRMRSACWWQVDEGYGPRRAARPAMLSTTDDGGTS